jgi:hypothetical protein
VTEPDVIVERCVVRVVRRGGWSWGPSPRDLPPGLVRALADLIAARYARLAEDGTDVVVTEPVRLVVPVRADALRGSPDRWRVLAESVVEVSGPVTAVPAVGSRHQDSTAQTDHSVPRPGHRPAPALENHAGRVLPQPAADLAEQAADFDMPVSGAASRRITESEMGAAKAGSPESTAVPAPVALARLLGAIGAEGRLSELLALLPQETLRRYAQALGTAQEAGSTGPRSTSAPRLDPAAPASQVAAGSEPSPARLPGPPEDTPATTRHRLIAAAELALTASDEPALAAALAEHYGVPPTGSPASPRVPASRLGSVEVRSALPFLVAAALERIGVLDRTGDALAGAGLDDEAPIFATALAYQCLGPLARGWRRPDTDHHDAAAFTGRPEDEPEPDLVAFARRAATALPLVDAVLGLAVAAGHEPGRALAVTRVAGDHGGGLLLAEVDGAFPVAWAENVDGLLPCWRAAGEPVTVLVGEPVGSAAVREMCASGVPLLAAFPPTRGERWQRLPGRQRLWASEPAAVPPAGFDPEPIAEALDRQMADAAQRAAVPLDGGRALQRTVTLAAGIGLATIAWQLWRDREPTDGPLAAERFGDLSAVVTHTPDEVRVRLPLGRRHADLDRSGLLADVPGVFWLGGRTLRFSGG